MNIFSSITSPISINEHLHVPITIIGRSQTISTAAMVDSGASTLFINERFVSEHNIRTRKYLRPIRLLNIDGTENDSGSITDYCLLKINIGGQEMEEIFTVAGIGKEEIIIGIDWLRLYNPIINFREGTLEIPEIKSLSVSASEDDDETRKIREKLPKQYWKYIDLFKKSKAERLPEHKDTDHAIVLKEGFVPTKGKVYPLSAPQKEALNTWTDDQLRKGYIRPSKSPNSAPFSTLR